MNNDYESDFWYARPGHSSLLMAESMLAHFISFSPESPEVRSLYIRVRTDSFDSFEELLEDKTLRNLIKTVIIMVIMHIKTQNDDWQEITEATEAIVSAESIKRSIEIIDSLNDN